MTADGANLASMDLKKSCSFCLRDLIRERERSLEEYEVPENVRLSA